MKRHRTALLWAALGCIIAINNAFGAPVVTVATRTGEEVLLADGISGDGGTVCFASNAPSLVPGDTNGQYDVFVWRRKTKQITRVSTADDGTETVANSGGDSSGGCALSFDGRYVAFATQASTIHPALEGNGGIVVVDLKTGKRVAAALPATDPGHDGHNYGLGGMSDNGRFIFFQAKSTYTTEPTVYKWQWYLWDRKVGTITLVTKSLSGGLGNSSAIFGEGVGTISPTGRYLHFSSMATDIVAGTSENGLRRNYLYDTKSGTLTLSVAGLLTPDESKFYSFVGKEGLYVRERKGKKSKLVKKLPVAGFGPLSASKTGRFLAVELNYQTKIFDTTRKLSQAIAGSTNVLTARLSRDGKAVFYRTDGGIFYRTLPGDKDS